MMRASLVSILAMLSLAACGGNNSNNSSGTTGTGTGSGGGTTTTTTTMGYGGHPAVGQPLTAPSEQWTWVDFPNTACGNGMPTGLAVNLTTKSSRVLIYLEGGGACWSDLTCYQLGTAANFKTGYTSTNFASDEKGLMQAGGFFDRTAAANPFKDYSYVFIPYCTGDIFAGNNVEAYPSGMGHHVGYTNMTAYLERIVPTFASAERVYISGSSAGGLGAAYNWLQTQQFFGTTRVDLIDDSGTPMPPDIEAKGMGEAQVRMSWNLAATLPADCPDCMTSLAALIPYYAKKFPGNRGALLSYVNDSVLPTFYGLTTAEFAQGLNELITNDFKPNPGLQSFTVNASGHVLWFGPQMSGQPMFMPQLQQFLSAMVTDQKDWMSQAL